MGEVKSSFGRPVLFVNPSYLLKTFVIQKLLEMEYEVYYVESIRNVKAILKKFPHALCFVDVDTSMPSEEYLNFIASIERNPEYSDVLIGVLTRRMVSIQKHYCEELKLGAGFINTSANKDTILNDLTTLFNAHEIKGRRQFVRVSLTNASGAQFYCKIQGLPTHFPLRDISSCGFACEAKGYPEAVFTVNSLIPGELQLGATILPCSVVLFAIKPAGQSLMLVMLFAQTNAWSNKKTIRGFVAETLQKTIDEIRATGMIDDMDYSKMDDSIAGLKPKKDDKPEGEGEAAEGGEAAPEAEAAGAEQDAGAEQPQQFADDEPAAQDQPAAEEKPAEESQPAAEEPPADAAPEAGAEQPQPEQA